MAEKICISCNKKIVSEVKNPEKEVLKLTKDDLCYCDACAAKTKDLFK